MTTKRLSTAVTALILAALACNLPGNTSQQPTSPEAAFTAAAQTVTARLTGVPQTQAASQPGTTDTPQPGATDTSLPAASATPTLAPPTPAPVATQPCDQMAFVADVTIADGTNEDPSTTFTKTWRVKNVGTCTWTSSYALTFVSGDAMGGPASVPLAGAVNPGDTVDLSVGLAAPASSGDYTGTWRLRNTAGVLFGLVTVSIHVTGGGVGVFAVVHVTYSTSVWNDSGHVNCPQITAHITTNGAGSVQYHWTDDGTGSATPQTLTYSSAGTQDVTWQWPLGSVWLGHSNWAGIYIDLPNHQDFGHTAVTACTSP